MTFAAVRRALLVVVLAGLFAWPATVRADQKAIAEARKLEAEAKVGVVKAQKALDTAKEAVKAKNPDYAAAQKEAAKAKVEQDAMMKAATEKSHASPEYVAAKKAFDTSDAEVKAIQLEIRAAGAGAGKPLTDKMNAATGKRAEAKTAMEKLENESVAADEKVQASKAALTAAEAKLAEQDKKLEEVAATDKACEDAKKALDEAQKKLDEAKAHTADVIKQNKDESKGKKGGNGGGRAGGGGGAAGGGAR